MSPCHYYETAQFVLDDSDYDVISTLYREVWTRKEFILYCKKNKIHQKLANLAYDIRSEIQVQTHFYNLARNCNILFAATKLLVLANRAKKKVEREYSPTGKRGLKCIKEYDESFNKVHKIL